MTLNKQLSEELFTGNGSTTLFNTGFNVPAKANLGVWKITIATGESELLTLDLDYSIDENTLDTEEGCEVTYPISGDPLADTHQLLLRRGVDYIQELDIQNQGGFNAESVEHQLDLIVMQIQQLVETKDRALKMFVGAPPDIVNLSTGYLYYDETNNTFVFNEGTNVPCPSTRAFDGTTDSPGKTDKGKIIRSQSDSAVTVTINDNATVGWGEVAAFSYLQEGDGQITFVAGGDTTFVYPDTSFQLKTYNETGSLVSFVLLEEDVWLVSGALAEA